MSGDWTKRVSKCFGAADKKFAGHPTDQKEAKALRDELVDLGVSYDDLEKEVVYYLYKKGCAKPHIDEQIKSVAKFFQVKLEAA